MTVSSTTSSIIYVGDGLTTEFDVPFRFLEDSDLQLSIQATDGTVTNLVLNSDYTVSGANEDNGGKVYLVNPVGDQAKLSILRIMDMLQETDYRENERFPAESHERALDKLTFEAQQLQAQLDRAITVDVFSDIDPDVLRQHIERVWESCDNIDTVADDIANVDTVSSNISDVNTTATNIADINTNAENISSINTNATNITDINTTAAHISEVETVSNNIADVSTVNDSIANVNTVAGSISNVDTVATNIADVNTTATNIEDVSTVAGISTQVVTVAGIAEDIDELEDIAQEISTVTGIADDVTTVAGISSDVTSVAGNSSNINAVAGNETNISAVNANKNNIDTVAGLASDISSVVGNATNINTVAGINTDVTTVSGISANVSSVAGNSTNINTVATNISDVNTAATNIAAIQAAPTAASNAATSANNASIWAEGTDAQVQALGGVHSSKVWAEVSAAGQIQSDWNQADNTKKDYIKNKPFIPTQAGDIGAVEANASITGATKCKITYDAKGLVTAGADLEEADIPSLHLAKVTDVTATATELNTLDGITASTTELNYVTGVTSDIQTQLNDRVTLNTAQTISGVKTFTAAPSIKNTNLPSNSTIPASGENNIWLYANANDDSYIGGIGFSVTTTASKTLLFARKNINGTDYTCYSGNIIGNDGTMYFTCPTPASATDNSNKAATTAWVRNHCCTTAATTTSTASKDAPAYVIENYKNGNAWYRKWSDGWIEQGGYATTPPGGGVFTVNLNKAFSTTNYQIIANAVSDGSLSTYYPYSQFAGKTTSSFKAAFYPNNTFYWYAYGY